MPMMLTFLKEVAETSLKQLMSRSEVIPTDQNSMSDSFGPLWFFCLQHPALAFVCSIQLAVPLGVSLTNISLFVSKLANSFVPIRAIGNSKLLPVVHVLGGFKNNGHKNFAVTERKIVENDEEIWKRFMAFAELAQASYGHASMRHRPSFPIHIGGWKFRFHRNFLSGSLWVWSCSESPVHNRDVKYVIVVRGTNTLMDLWRDFCLATGSAESYQSFVLDRYINGVNDCVKELSKENRKAFKVMFCGHSLGGSIAEALHFYSTGGKFHKWVSSAGCVSFDSPGQPTSYRKIASSGFSEETLSQSLWTLNARPNLVNTLYPPVSKNLYSCGQGSEVYLVELVWNTPLNFIVGLLEMLKKSTHDHSVDDILSYIRTCDIRKEAASDWPLWSGLILQLLCFQKKQ